MHHHKHMIEIGRDHTGVKRTIAVDEHDDDNVVANVPFAMQLLWVGLGERQHVTHVEHHFEVTILRVHTILASATRQETVLLKWKEGRRTG